MTLAEVSVIFGMVVAVYLPKVLPLVLIPERVTVRLRRWLQYIAPAVLGALVAPSIAAPTGRLTAPGWDQLAYVVAFMVAVMTRRMIPSLVAGMLAIVALALLRW